MNDPYPYVDEARPDILRMIPQDGRVIGSIGCGTAATEAVLVRAGREVHGVDVHAPSIEIAKTRITSARAVTPDESELFAPESLDGLILADVIEHMPQAWKRLKAFAGFVRPGGWVAISVPNMRSLSVLRHFLLAKDWPEEPNGIFDDTHLQVMTRKRLARWTNDAGLDKEREFEMYDPRMPRWENTIRRFDRLTFGLLHEWLTYEVQFLCRKRR